MSLSPLISKTKIDAHADAWSEIQEPLKSILDIIQSNNISKSQYQSRNFPNLAKETEKKLSEYEEKINEIIGKYDEMGISGNIIISDQIEKYLWNTK